MSIVSYLEEVTTDQLKYTQNNEEVHLNCLMCDDKRKRMYVNLHTHRVYCHNCGYSATFIGLMKDLENISYDRAIERYKDVKGSAYIPEDVLVELSKNLILGDVSHSISMRPIPLPEEYIPLNFKSRNPVMKSAIKYLMLNRKISIRQMKTHDFGICLDGEYKNRVIIPIKEAGEHKFFVGRAIGNNVKMKEKSPSNESYQISKSQVIFNIDNASALYNSCVLSEGIFDALSFGDIGSSLLGKRMSDYQLAILLDYRSLLTNGVYIALDGDARKDALDMARELYNYFPVHLINLPKDEDPNSYYKKFGREAMFELIDNAEEYSGMQTYLRQKFFMK